MHPTTWLVDQSIHLEGTRRLEDELNDLEEIAGGSCYLIAQFRPASIQSRSWRG
jgi:hypothetical protein